jgi:Fic family protein
VDEFYWQDRPRYYKELRAARQQGGDLTGWLEYSAEGLHVTLEALWQRIARLAAGRASARLVLRPRQEQLLGLLRQRGRMARARYGRRLTCRGRERWTCSDL